MEGKESPKKEVDLKPKLAGISHRLFSIIKLILGVIILPFVYSTSVSFVNEFMLIEKSLQIYFWSGLVSLLIIYLFIWEPIIIYNKGQRILELVFSFFKPLVKVAPYLLPVYTIVLFVLYGILYFLFKPSGLINYFIFLSGFSIGLHLIFSAKSLRSKQADSLKANYIFGFSFIYIINLVLLSFCLNFILEAFSFINFANNSFLLAKKIFENIFKQLFL